MQCQWLLAQIGRDPDTYRVFGNDVWSASSSRRLKLARRPLKSGTLLAPASIPERVPRVWPCSLQHVAVTWVRPVNRLPGELAQVAVQTTDVTKADLAHAPLDVQEGGHARRETQVPALQWTRSALTFGATTGRDAEATCRRTLKKGRVIAYDPASRNLATPHAPVRRPGRTRAGRSGLAWTGGTRAVR